MKTIIIVLSFLASASIAVAQDNWVDIIYLKNGSVIRGHITERTADKSITIKAGDLSEFVIQMDDINKIVKERPNTSSYSNAALDAPDASEPRVISRKNRIQPMAAVFRRSEIELGAFYIRTVAASLDGMQSLGVGLGLDSYALISILANGRTLLSSSGFKTHLYGELGLSMNGLTAAAGLGGTLSTGAATDFTIAGGLKLVNDEYQAIGLTLSIGVEF